MTENQARRGRVVRSQSGFIDVELDAEGGAQGEVVRCRLRGRLKQGKQSADTAVIGDFVHIQVEEGTVESVEPRQTRFSRRSPGNRGKWREDVVIANLDHLVAVFCYGKPAFRPRMVDRFLLIAEQNQIDATLVVNKRDLASETDDVNDLYDAIYRYRTIGYEVIETEVSEGRLYYYGSGLEALRARLAGRTSAFSGPSGVGKSTLISALAPDLKLVSGETSASTGKGKHTTRVAELHRLTTGFEGPEPTYVADTPGIREIGTWKLPTDEIQECFVEFRPLLGSCRFGNCLHRSEPGCTIREAVHEAQIDPLRYESYLKLVDEAEAEASAEYR